MTSTNIFNPMHPFDLIKELRRELPWTKEFATKAFYEYYRWMRLRVHCDDLLYCKLPPSNIIATVWAVHRQYTLDYQHFCAGFGAFVHHFPPAMKMGRPRVVAYRSTIQEYKAFYEEDPPVSQWNVANEFAAVT